jgi:hypothetical protein
MLNNNGICRKSDTNEILLFSIKTWYGDEEIDLTHIL